jgi:hypothetical protein
VIPFDEYILKWSRDCARSLNNDRLLNLPDSEQAKLAARLAQTAEIFLFPKPQPEQTEVADQPKSTRLPSIPMAVRRWDAEKQEWSGSKGTPKCYRDLKALNPDWEIDKHLRSEWGPWVSSPEGLPRHQLKAVDLSAYQRLYNWLRNNTLPDDIRVPIKPEVTDRLAAQYPDPATRPASLDGTLRSRQRRASNG